MRPGHKSSGGLQEGFEADIEVKPMVEAVEQRQLVDEGSAQGKALGVAHAVGGDRAMDAEDPLDVFVGEEL